MYFLKIEILHAILVEQFAVTHINSYFSTSVSYTMKYHKFVPVLFTKLPESQPILIPPPRALAKVHMNTICVFPACSLLGDKFNKLQFFCTPFPSHKRTTHYLKIEILVPNARSNFDVPHINSYLSRISNVINLLRFLQRCRSPSPSPILTSAPHCSLPRCIIHTLIALHPNRLSFLGHLTSLPPL